MKLRPCFEAPAQDQGQRGSAGAEGKKKNFFNYYNRLLVKGGWRMQKKFAWIFPTHTAGNFSIKGFKHRHNVDKLGIKLSLFEKFGITKIMGIIYWLAVRF